MIKRLLISTAISSGILLTTPTQAQQSRSSQVNQVEFPLEMITIGSALAAAAWFVWQRYQSTEQRLDGIERCLIKIEHHLELSTQKHETTLNNLDYLVANNTKQINDLYRILREEIKESEQGLRREMQTIERFLEKNSEFSSRRDET